MKDRTILEFKKKGEVATMLKGVYPNGIVFMELDSSQPFIVGTDSAPTDRNYLTGREIELRFNDTDAIDGLIADLTKIKVCMERKAKLGEWEVYTKEFTFDLKKSKKEPVTKVKRKKK